MLPRRDGLLRIGDWAATYTDSLASVARVGDRIDVQVTEVGADGKFKVSRKAMLAADAAAGDEAVSAA